MFPTMIASLAFSIRARVRCSEARNAASAFRRSACSRASPIARRTADGSRARLLLSTYSVAPFLSASTALSSPIVPDRKRKGTWDHLVAASSRASPPWNDGSV